MNVKVEVKNLKKSFHKLNVLNGIDLTVYEGEVVCIIGPSGSGKSTLLRCLNRLEDATGGQVIVDGYNITDKKTNINLAFTENDSMQTVWHLGIPVLWEEY